MKSLKFEEIIDNSFGHNIKCPYCKKDLIIVIDVDKL
jgi:hypothetical protein